MPKTLMCAPALFEKNLSGRVYIVTGANSGSGLATTEQLVRQGAHVIAACRRVSAGQEATKQLAGERGSAVYVRHKNRWRLLHKGEELDALLEEARALTLGGGPPPFERRYFQLGRDPIHHH